ncbi:hypothetical protein M404DRAFT_33207 [Pisolithus tinctorius Marx 270]|uniref:Uncharacterized protein n=1 Tax=Pisolithus tinctorius Marx 270 TaxID=870435 RepID=A0A0C3NME0_PISTI|nr:hypothetical protein M404DRAFT_33207 [Pisolithus tinctorius Marx 270]
MSQCEIEEEKEPFEGEGEEEERHLLATITAFNTDQRPHEARKAIRRKWGTTETAREDECLRRTAVAIQESRTNYDRRLNGSTTRATTTTFDIDRRLCEAGTIDVSLTSSLFQGRQLSTTSRGCDARAYDDLRADVVRVYSKTGATTTAQPTAAVLGDTRSDRHGHRARRPEFLF